MGMAMSMIANFPHPGCFRLHAHGRAGEKYTPLHRRRLRSERQTSDVCIMLFESSILDSRCVPSAQHSYDPLILVQFKSLNKHLTNKISVLLKVIVIGGHQLISLPLTIAISTSYTKGVLMPTCK
jgi:hypothetical protein